MTEKKLLLDGKEVKAEDHIGVNLPHCPFCGKQLLALWQKEETGFVRLVSIGLSMILYCIPCEELWKKEGVYFALIQLDKKEWNFEEVKA